VDRDGSVSSQLCLKKYNTRSKTSHFFNMTPPPPPPISTMWMHALAATDMNLVFGYIQPIHEFRDALKEETHLVQAWENLLGHTPPIIFELMSHPGGDSDLASRVATTRYNYLSLRQRPVHIHQVKAVALRIVTPTVSDKQYRRKTYIQTMEQLKKHGFGHLKAAATAFHLHTQSTESQPTPSSHLDIMHKSPGGVDHLDLSSSYLGVDVMGSLWVLDTTLGVVRVRLGSRVPAKWIHRTSPNSNTFLLGDDTRCVGVVLSQDLTSGIETPVTLQTLPLQPRVVDNTWVVWGDTTHPHAIQWTPQKGTRVSSHTDAKLHLMSIPQNAVFARGDRIMFNHNEHVTQIPPCQSISCIVGTPLAVDLITTAHDFYRIDVRANKAWCVGINIEHPIVAMAPLVSWS